MSQEPTRLTHAQSARTIMKRCRNGALSTLATSPDGFPYGSLVSHAMTQDGDPVLLLSNLAEHTQNLRRDPRASLLVTDSLRRDDPLADGRVCALGHIAQAAAAERDALRALMLQAHPEAELYLDFDDFNLYRLRVSDVRYIGGFGRMSWVDLEGWRAAEPDPLWEAAQGIIDHMNDDHADALVHYARHFGGLDAVERALMIAVDQHGFDLIAHKDQGRPERLRLAFSRPVDTANLVRKELVRMVKEARGEG